MLDLFAHHSVPRFEGAASRSHDDVPVWRLAVRGARAAVRHRRALGGLHTFVQFAGFPRSGHSLVGSLLDAHPEASVAHELDAMGLVAAGLPTRLVRALALDNSAAFTRHRRYWNGFSYVVPAQPHGPTLRLTVAGDKKGDWAVRRFGRDPGLLDRLARRTRLRYPWILVTRHPLDNIATMSLRRGRHYDRLRIAADGSADFHQRLAEAQSEGRVADHALDEMIDDYEGLCEGIGAMKHAVDPDDWIEVGYERFVARPREELARLCHALELAPHDDYLDACASVVRESTNRSRDRIGWADAQRRRVADLIRRFEFLHEYVDTDAVA